MRRLRRLSLLLAGSLLAGPVLAGCGGLPEAGPVRGGSTQAPPSTQAPFDFDPPGPARGASRDEIVHGFLTALQASPVSTKISREFLTPAAAEAWQPGRRTIVYSSERPAFAPGGMRVHLAGIVELDAQGRWLGPSRPTEMDLRLRLARVHGQWRITNPPDAMVVPRSHFELRYERFFLYFLDPTAEVLVPESVYLPRGVQAPTLLTSGLLDGPGRGLGQVERSFFPPGTRLDISVPVDGSGTAQVPLTEEILDLDRERLDKALAQLGWTLRQVPGVQRLRITVDGAPLDLPGSDDWVGVDGWSELDPALPWAVGSLYGVRGNRVVEAAGGKLERVVGAAAPSGSPGPVGVDLIGQRVAMVLDDGREVVVARRVPSGNMHAQRTVYRGSDLLRPAWDLHGHLWLVDGSPSGARVVVVRGGRARGLEAPAIAGATVRAFALSRDGSRLAAVVASPLGDRLLVARVHRSESGVPVRLARPKPLALPPAAGARLLDVRWGGPTRLAVLARPSPRVAQMLVTGLDGVAVLDDEGPVATPLVSSGARLATRPGEEAPVYVGTSGGRLFELASNGRWMPADLPGRLRWPVFAG